MRRTYAVIAAWTLLALLVIPVYPHFVSPNEVTRWLLAAALVEDGSVEVSRFVPLVGPRFDDLAIKDGRTYSNKAPGLALLSLPGYLALRPSVGEPSPFNLRPVLTAMRLFGATLPLVLLALLFVRVAREANVSDERSAFVVCLLLFATPLFVYGLLLFSHALVAAALFGAWVCLFGLREPRDLLGGALIGLAVASEYPAIAPAAALVMALLTTRDWRRVTRVVLAGLPFAVALGLYHFTAYGSPFTLPSHYEKVAEYRAIGSTGLFGIHLPSPMTLLSLLFDPARGLLVFSPVVVLAIPAFVSLRQKLAARAWWTLVLVPAATLLFYAGYANWHGGWNVGPRYLVPMLPFLMAAMLLGGRRWPRAEALLAGWSVLAVVGTSLVFPFPPNAFAFPWMTFSAPLLGRGLVTPNVFHLLARPLAIAIPFLLVIAATGFALRRSALYAIIGALAAIAIGAQGERLAPRPLLALQRAYVAEVYFEKRGSLPVESPPGLIRRRELELTLPPAPWPF
ncbi:MAG TPA: hypothetical protein VF618_27390 [Thermoanaerobaculia bacterium]